MSIPPHEFIANNAPDMSADDASVSTVSGRLIAIPRQGALRRLRYDAQGPASFNGRSCTSWLSSGWWHERRHQIDAQDVMFKKVQLATRAARYNVAELAVLFMTAIEVNATFLTRPTKLSCWPARLRTS